jgi:hypothetical protein
MRTLADIEQDITDACQVMREYREVGDLKMAAHYERWMNVKLDELALRLPITVGATECAGSPG